MPSKGWRSKNEEASGLPLTAFPTPTRPDPAFSLFPVPLHLWCCPWSCCCPRSAVTSHFGTHGPFSIWILTTSPFKNTRYPSSVSTLPGNSENSVSFILLLLTKLRRLFQIQLWQTRPHPFCDCGSELAGGGPLPASWLSPAWKKLLASLVRDPLAFQRTAHWGAAWTMGPCQLSSSILSSLPASIRPPPFSFSFSLCPTLSPWPTTFNFILSHDGAEWFFYSFSTHLCHNSSRVFILILKKGLR